jgi:hypothetical protein
MHEDVAERFWAKVDKRGPDECWPWQAGTDDWGYGTFWMHGQYKKAHRVSLEMHDDQPIPEGLLALHSCDNPPCVNPGHLWSGTDLDNRHDAMAKGRTSNGAKKRERCKRGHELVDGNLRFNSRGERQCKTCCNAAQLVSYRRHRTVKKPRT